MSTGVLGSRPKIEILSLLLEEEEVNITTLVRESGLGYKTVERHLKELQDLGLVTEKRFGRIRTVKLKGNDPRISSLRRFLMEWKLSNELRI